MKIRRDLKFCEVNALIGPYVELDIYGSDENLTVIGETETRLASRHVGKFERKLETIKRNL